MVELKKDQKKALDKLLQDEPPVKELPPKENADDQVDSKKLQKRTNKSRMQLGFFQIEFMDYVVNVGRVIGLTVSAHACSEIG